jgi:hypothetical protein
LLSYLVILLSGRRFSVDARTAASAAFLFELYGGKRKDASKISLQKFLCPLALIFTENMITFFYG